MEQVKQIKDIKFTVNHIKSLINQRINQIQNSHQSIQKDQLYQELKQISYNLIDISKQCEQLKFIELLPKNNLPQLQLINEKLQIDKLDVDKQNYIDEVLPLFMKDKIFEQQRYDIKAIYSEILQMKKNMQNQEILLDKIGFIKQTIFDCMLFHQEQISREIKLERDPDSQIFNFQMAEEVEMLQQSLKDINNVIEFQNDNNHKQINNDIKKLITNFL
ncbi:hypothetical protein PPERSA_07709 [Pseudocohnilembus persalinus]|uniref:Uncharacterized protein n=1 Tax=Pseudocohnilembus persalinus TaxID=266149 RepID=A0A0V0R250_PSEPJ|nr:hypothetical protein PPERSA_07709 [Pseudocohnilembus persalinus]|eukprot:KRX08229.1 hypothetical protein PPERSA_07709 [Pseudocohnilembus persalinus]